MRALNRLPQVVILVVWALSGACQGPSWCGGRLLIEELAELERKLEARWGSAAPASAAPEMVPLVEGIRQASAVVRAEWVVSCLDHLRAAVMTSAASNDFLIVVSIRGNTLRAGAVIRREDSSNWLQICPRPVEEGLEGAQPAPWAVWTECAKMPSHDWQLVWTGVEKVFKCGAIHAYLLGRGRPMGGPRLAVWLLRHHGTEYKWVCSSLDEAHPLSWIEAVVCGCGPLPFVEDSR